MGIRDAHDTHNLVAIPVNPSSPASHLPRLSGPTIGRERELAQIQARLQDPEVSLVTLVGPGGVGKTRLALHVAKHRLSGHSGIWFVDLQHLSDSSQVPAVVATALRLGDAGGPAPLERLIAWIEPRQMLLILDNFERVLDAGSLVSELLTACPRLTVLVTSRVTLNVTGEHVIRIPPLACPAPEDMQSLEHVSRSDSVQLFMLRATAVDPGFTLTTANMAAVASVCQRLDGLPLAIELAAARSRHMNAASLLDRLDQRFEMLTGGPEDAPPRMQSLRQAIAWSYDLLAPAEQHLFNQLSIFSGSFSLEAVEAVCAVDLLAETGNPIDLSAATAPLRSVQVVRRLASLIDRSLVETTPGQDGETRYTLLDSLREYGRERLRATGKEKETGDRHAAWCLELAETAVRERVGLAPIASSDRLGAERGNIRRALEWLKVHREHRAALRLATALWPLWLERGEVSEGRAEVAALLATSPADTPPLEWARAAWVYGALAQAQGDHDQAVAFSRQALDRFNTVGDARGAAAALTTLGLDAMIAGDLDTADRYLEDALLRFRQVRDPRAGGWALRHLSSVAFRRGNLARARSRAEEGITIVRATGQTLDLARLLLNLGYAALLQGDLDHADAAFAEALPLFQAAGDRWGIADVLQRLGSVAIERGEGVQAIDPLEASRVLFEAVGDPEGLAVVLVQLAWLYRSQAITGVATDHLERAFAIARESRNPSRIASALLAEGAIAFDSGDVQRAARSWLESLQLAAHVHDQLALAAVLEWTAHLAEDRRAEVAARLMGAACAVRSAARAPIPALIRTEHTELIARLEHTLARSLSCEAPPGAGLSLDAATAEALAILESPPTSVPQRGRASSRRVSHPSVHTLSAREQETLRLLAQGLTNRQVAVALSISSRTVENHVQHIYDKLGVTSRAGATAYAIRHGLD